MKPSSPVAQNGQPTAQPACELMQTVVRPRRPARRGCRIRTDSMRCPSASSWTALAVSPPSATSVWLPTIDEKRNASATAPRSGIGRSVRSSSPRAVGFPQGAGTLSVAAAAVIAHEVGHALQDRERDPWMVARQSIVPAVQLGSGLAPWLIIAGVWFNMFGLAMVGLVAFGAAVVFTFLTLPVEIGASGKALAFVSSLGITGERQVGARDVLKAAAWTYVAAALAALLTFLYYLMLIMGRRD